jgi:hypothetical protein
MSSSEASSPPSSLLDQIIQLLKQHNSNSNNRQSDAMSNVSLMSAIAGLVPRLENTKCSLTEFGQFLANMHNDFVRLDSSMRSLLMRAIRYNLIDEEHCCLLIQHEYHWLLVNSLEKEAELIVERMQALKIFNTFANIAPQSFPLSFLR